MKSIFSLVPASVRALGATGLTSLALLGAGCNHEPSPVVDREQLRAQHAGQPEKQIADLETRVNKYKDLNLTINTDDPRVIEIYKKMLKRHIAEDVLSIHFADLARFIDSYNKLELIESGKLKPNLDAESIETVKKFYEDQKVRLPIGFDFQSVRAYDLYTHVLLHNLAMSHIDIINKLDVGLREVLSNKESVSEQTWHELFKALYPGQNAKDYELPEIKELVEVSGKERWSLILKLATRMSEDLRRDLTQPAAMAGTGPFTSVAFCEILQSKIF